MFVPSIAFGLALTWLFSAVTLTLCIYLVSKIMGWRTETGFWAPFPMALLVCAILTIIDWGLGFFPVPFLGSLFRIFIWFLVMMKAFDMEFLEAIILAIIMFITKFIFTLFVISTLFSLLR